MKANKIFVLGCFALALLVAPALALAEPGKPFRVNSIVVGASLEASISTTAFLSMSVEQRTDDNGFTQTTLDFLFIDTDIQVTCVSIANVSVSVSKNGDILTIFIRPQSLPGCNCTGSNCATAASRSFVSLTFTKNHTYKFTREGSEKGELADGTKIHDTFKQTFEGADVTGSVFGASFFSDDGQLMHLRGDPDLAK